MGIWEIVVGAVVLILSVIMIIVIILQEGHEAGLGTITGGADSFLGKGKARTADAMFARITKYCAIIFFIVVVLLNALSYFGLTGKADNGATAQSSTSTEVSVTSDIATSTTESSTASSSASSSTESSTASSSTSSSTESSTASSSTSSSTESSAVSSSASSSTESSAVSSSASSSAESSAASVG